MSLLTGRTVAVTGGARGIGAAIVRRFAAEGAHGTTLDTRPAADLPDGWRAVQVDVRDTRGLAASLAHVGAIDVLVAAAGIVPGWRETAELDLDEWDEVFRVNVRGMAATVKHAGVVDGGAIIAVG